MTKKAQSEISQTLNSAGTVGGVAALGALVGFVLQLVVAYNFGASTVTDAYFMASSTSELLTKLLLGGSVTAVFLPLFIERIARGEKQYAWDLALNVLHIATLVFVLATIVLAIFARPFITLIAPGFEGETQRLTVGLLRVLLPSFVALFLVDITTAMLQALKQFAVPALVRLINPLVSILTVVTLVSYVGIYALALGVVTGSILQVIVLWYHVRRQGMRYHFIFRPDDPAIRRLLHLVYPFVFSVVVTSVAGLVYRILVSGLDDGSLASLKFAEKITQLLTIIFLNSVTFVIYPLLSEKASRGDMRGIRETIGAAVRLVVLATVPLVIGVALLREPLVRLVYQRGSFSAEDVALTKVALLFLVIGLTTNGISSVLGHATLALQKTKAAVVTTLLSQVAAVILFFILVPRMQHAGLALASSLVPLVIMTLYFIYLRPRVPRLNQIFWHTTYSKVGVLALLLWAVVWWLRNVVEGWHVPGVLGLLVQLGIPTLVGSAIFFGGAYVWRVPEMAELKRIVMGAGRKIFRSSSLGTPDNSSL